MNTLAKWDPFKQLDEFSNRLSSFFNVQRSGIGDEAWPSSLTGWEPVVDISEDASEYLIEAELPNIRREDVKVNVENGVLTLSGERKLEKEESDRKYHRVERAYGAYTRSFTLPDGVMADRIHAEFKDGILRVHVPKDEKAKPKAIDIRVE